MLLTVTSSGPASMRSKALYRLPDPHVFARGIQSTLECMSSILPWTNGTALFADVFDKGRHR